MQQKGDLTINYTQNIKEHHGDLDNLIQPFLPMWETLPIGILVSDPKGNVLFYNKVQGHIDNLSVEFALGQDVHDLYGPDPGPSLVTTCIQTKKPVINYVCVYRTIKGNIINAACWVFPFIKNQCVLGCICYVQNLDKLSESPVVSRLQDLPVIESQTVRYINLTSKNLKMNDAIETARHASATPSPVLLYGRTGTGKDLFARNIHSISMQNDQPFVALNCAAIPETLLESLLFGTNKGAFTGAMDKAGLFEQANGGTLFLDETDSMPLTLQPKLLRVLQDKRIRRMGSEKEIQLSLKIISAMSRDPLESVTSGKLRPDLFYRLGVVVIGIPPLKDRPEDLEDLCTYFILKYNTLLGKKVRSVCPTLLVMFSHYDWPGNVRELEHMIEAAMNVTHDTETIKPEMIPEYFLKHLRDSPLGNGQRKSSPMPENFQTSPRQNISLPTLEQMAAPLKNDENAIIAKALETTFGNITMAANILGVSRQNLSYKMKKQGLNRNDFRTLSKTRPIFH